MAFRRRFGPFQRQWRGQKSSRQVPRWTAQTLEINLTAAAPTSYQTLYTPGTTIGTGAYEEESLLARVVGRLAIHADAATTASGVIGLGILKTGFTAVTAGATNDPLIATELATRDWLGVYNTQIPPNAGANGFIRYQELDIRVKRRMKRGEELALICVSAVGDDVVITIDIRILVVIRL